MSLSCHVPYSPLGILNITLVARNDVNMHMQDTLPCRRPNINADIIAIRLELLINELFFFLNQLHTGAHLFKCQLEKAGNMTLRDDNRMPWARRVSITCTVRKFIIQRHPLRVCTKQAWVIEVSLFFLFF